MLIIIILILLLILTFGGGKFADCQVIRIEEEYWFPDSIKYTMIYTPATYNDEFFKNLNVNQVGETGLQYFKEKAKFNVDFYEKYAQKTLVPDLPKLNSFAEFLSLPTHMKQSYSGLLRIYTYIYTRYKPVIRTNINMLTTPVSFCQVQGLRIKKSNFDPQRTQNQLATMFADPAFKKIKASTGIEHLIVDPSAIDTIKTRRKLCSEYIQDLPQMEKLNCPKYQYIYQKITDFVNEHIKPLHLYDSVSISFAHHLNNAGIRVHLDGLNNSDLNIFAINIGCDIYYDMFPIFLEHQRNGYRFKIPNGHYTEMYGSARYEWAHAIPDGLDLSNRYAIIMKVRSKLSNMEVTNYEIYKTPQEKIPAKELIDF